MFHDDPPECDDHHQETDEKKPTKGVHVGCERLVKPIQNRLHDRLPFSLYALFRELTAAADSAALQHLANQAQAFISHI